MQIFSHAINGSERYGKEHGRYWKEIREFDWPYTQKTRQECRPKALVSKFPGQEIERKTKRQL